MIGKIIAFEGIDGSGKSTYINSRKLNVFLEKNKIQSVSSEEFSQTGADLRIKCRDILLSNIDPTEELLIVSLTRRWHYQNILKPLLDKDVYVLMDRFIDSTYAYQGGGGQVDRNIITYFEQNIWLAPKPDVVIYFESKYVAKEYKDRIESKNYEYFKKVCDEYNKNKNANWICVCRDAMTDVEIQRTIEKELINILKLK
jgi:dTMP kinase